MITSSTSANVQLPRKGTIFTVFCVCACVRGSCVCYCVRVCACAMWMYVCMCASVWANCRCVHERVCILHVYTSLSRPRESLTTYSAFAVASASFSCLNPSLRTLLFLLHWSLAPRLKAWPQVENPKKNKEMVIYVYTLLMLTCRTMSVFAIYLN